MTEKIPAGSLRKWIVAQEAAIEQLIVLADQAMKAGARGECVKILKLQTETRHKLLALGIAPLKTHGGRRVGAGAKPKIVIANPAVESDDGHDLGEMSDAEIARLAKAQPMRGTTDVVKRRQGPLSGSALTRKETIARERERKRLEKEEAEARPVTPHMLPIPDADEWRN